MSDTAVATRSTADRPLPDKRAAIAAAIADGRVSYNPHNGPYWFLQDPDVPTGRHGEVIGSAGRALRALRTQQLADVDLLADPDAGGAYPVVLTEAGRAALARHQGHAG